MGLLTYVIGGAVGAAVGIPAALVAAPLIIGAVGFSASGVVAGSLAAGAQASIGNVVAGSAFALLQSAGVLGLAGTTQVAVGPAGGTAAGAIGTAVAAILI